MNEPVSGPDRFDPTSTGSWQSAESQPASEPIAPAPPVQMIPGDVAAAVPSSADAAATPPSDIPWSRPATEMAPSAWNAAPYAAPAMPTAPAPTAPAPSPAAARHRALHSAAGHRGSLHDADGIAGAGERAVHDLRSH